jgi:hypothetical protein
LENWVRSFRFENSEFSFGEVRIHESSHLEKREFPFAEFGILLWRIWSCLLGDSEFVLGELRILQNSPLENSELSLQFSFGEFGVLLWGIWSSDSGNSISSGVLLWRNENSPKFPFGGFGILLGRI